MPPHLWTGRAAVAPRFGAGLAQLLCAHRNGKPDVHARERSKAARIMHPPYAPTLTRVIKAIPRPDALHAGSVGWSVCRSSIYGEIMGNLVVIFLGGFVNKKEIPQVRKIFKIYDFQI